MADYESGEEFESAESETELTDKDITEKFPSLDIKPNNKTIVHDSTKDSQANDDKTTQHGSEETSANEDKVINTPKEVNQQTQDPETPIDKPIAQTDSSTALSQSESGGGWGWGWGNTIGSLLSSSVSAVSESAQSIGKGIESMVTNVEGALGVPQPTEMVRDPPSADGDGDNDENKIKEEKSDGDNPEKETSEPEVVPAQTSGVGGLLSGFTSAVQTTGIELMSGGLDALEAIGRKTVDILSEGDPGLRNKRAVLSGKATNLSQLLREAKQEAETIQEKMASEGSHPSDHVVNYSILFDQYEGLVHLEALELLSKDCKNKVFASLSGFSGQELDDRNKRIEELDQYFQDDDDEEDASNEPSDGSSVSDILNILDGLGKKVKAEKLIKACEEARKKISLLGQKQVREEDSKGEPPSEEDDTKDQPSSEGADTKGDPRCEEDQDDRKDTPLSKDGDTAAPLSKNGDTATPLSKEGDTATPPCEDSTSSDEASISVKECHDTGLHTLAELTSLTIELLKKSAEILLLQNVVKIDESELGQMFQKVTRLISAEFEAIATLLTDKISEETSDEADASITSLYLESSNSCSYIQDAFKLLQPVLQLLVLENFEKASITREQPVSIAASSAS